MTPNNKDRNFDLDRTLQAMRDDVPADRQLNEGAARVWSRLKNTDVVADVEQIRSCADVRHLLPALAAHKLTPSRELLVRDHLRECLACRAVAETGSSREVVWQMPTPARNRWRFPQFAVAAAALAVVLGVALFLGWYYQTPAGSRGVVQSASGDLFRVTPTSVEPIAAGAELQQGELIRTAGGAHAFVRLSDGSVVEMSERSQFSVNARRKDTTIDLNGGRIIVQAAHRRTGHLYVVTPDAKVAVTGTVFAVNTGMKGSRVSVIEGAVRVAYNGTDTVLHPGDQANTGANLSQVPISQDIAWSQNLDKHLALLAEFAKLKKEFEQIPLPGARYSSAILDKLPANTVFYASIPNLGDALNQANRIFQNELQQSAVLREWWNNGHRNAAGEPTFDQMIQKLHGFSQYLGDEIVVAGFTGQDRGGSGTVVIAPIKSPGLRQYMEQEFQNLESHDGKSGGLTILGEDQLATATPVRNHGLTAVVGDHFLLISPTPSALRLVDHQLKSATGGFAQTAFGQRLSVAYNHGASLLFAVDLHQIMATQRMLHPAAQTSAGLQATGFNDADYLLLQSNDLAGGTGNRAVLSFTGPRHGIASWLAAPDPIGSMQFVSANAGAAFSFLTKDPSAMLDDVLRMAHGDAQRGIAEVDAKLNLDIRSDIAAQLGGDVTLAFDGPVLPKPAWKAIVQVYDTNRLQHAIATLVQAINADVAQHQRPGIELSSESVDGRLFYRLRALDPKALGTEVDYTYADGYLVAGPSRAIVQAALRTKANGDSLATSSDFLSLLPKDGHVNFSAVAYQNLGPLLKPLADTFSAQQMDLLRQIAAESKPTAICAYAGENSIEVASNTRLLPFDLNSITLSTLLGGHRSGTSHPKQP